MRFLLMGERGKEKLVYPFVRCAQRQTGKVSNSKAIETFTVKGVSFNMIKVVSAADSARYHQKVLSVCDMIRQKVMDYSTLSQYMTSKGVNDYKKLMEKVWQYQC